MEVECVKRWNELFLREQGGDPRCEAAKGGSKTQGEDSVRPKGSREKGASLFLYDSPGTLERGKYVVSAVKDHCASLCSPSFSPDGNVC